jgi:predicted amidohydrolase YtcJ
MKLSVRGPVALALACGGLIVGAAEAFAQEADRIWSGGSVLTMNDSAMRAEAVAERDGRIIAVGTVDEVMKLKGEKTQVIDITGKTMLPGFVDAHGHVMFGGLQRLSANVLPPPDGGVADIASLQQTIRDWIKNNEAAVAKTNLIVAFGYDPAQLREGRHPTRDDLDAVAKDIPMIVVHQSGHIYAVNSKALDVCGIDASTPDPAGGVIRRRDGSQEPNGVLEETAGFPVLAKLLGGIGTEGFRMFAENGAELWASYGFTTAQEGRALPGSADLLRAIGKAGKLKIDVAIYPDVLVDRDYIKENVSKTYEGHTRVVGAKLTIDGSVQGFTAWRDKPYYNPPKGLYPPAYSGYAAATPEQVNSAIDWAYANGIQIITHSNGEASSDLLIACLTAAGEKHGSVDRRPVLIHGQLLREDQIDSLNRLGVVPSLFPMHTFYWGDMHRDQTVGPAASNNISPTGWCVTRGMKFTTHHDAPVAFPDSMRVLDATVTRRSRSGDIIGPDHRVDVITALKAMTLWSAYQHFEEDTKGSIEVGKLADLVVLSTDPTAIDPEALDSIRILQTIKEGVTIYDRPADADADASREAIAPVIASTIEGLATYREGPGRAGQHAASCFSNTILALSSRMVATASEDHELLQPR